MKGLQFELFKMIKEKGIITYDQMVQKTNQLGYKVDTGTRKMRLLTEKSDKHNPLIKNITNDKGVITGYRWIGTPQATLIPKPEQRPLVGLNLTSQTTYKSHYDN